MADAVYRGGAAVGINAEVIWGARGAGVSVGERADSSRSRLICLFFITCIAAGERKWAVHAVSTAG